jgi:hypothetical protein
MLFDIEKLSAPLQQALAESTSCSSFKIAYGMVNGRVVYEAHQRPIGKAFIVRPGSKRVEKAEPEGITWISAYPEPTPANYVLGETPSLVFADLNITLRQILQQSFDESGFGVAQGTSKEGAEYLALMHAPGEVMISRRGASSIEEKDPSGVSWVKATPYSE